MKSHNLDHQQKIKKSGWTNIYPNFIRSPIYKTKSEAMSDHHGMYKDKIIDTIEIHWEESNE